LAVELVVMMVAWLAVEMVDWKDNWKVEVSDGMLVKYLVETRADHLGPRSAGTTAKNRADLTVAQMASMLVEKADWLVDLLAAMWAAQRAGTKVVPSG